MEQSSARAGWRKRSPSHGGPIDRIGCRPEPSSPPPWGPEHREDKARNQTASNGRYGAFCNRVRRPRLAESPVSTAATAGWRRRFSHSGRFEPTAESSPRFNLPEPQTKQVAASWGRAEPASATDTWLSRWLSSRMPISWKYAARSTLPRSASSSGCRATPTRAAPRPVRSLPRSSLSAEPERVISAISGRTKRDQRFPLVVGPFVPTFSRGPPAVPGKAQGATTCYLRPWYRLSIFQL